MGILKQIIWILIALTTMWAVGFLTYYVAACGSHPDAAWGGLLPFAQYCIKTERFEEAYAISDFLLDTFVLIVPLPSVSAPSDFAHIPRPPNLPSP